jgi:hypothetical protein
MLNQMCRSTPFKNYNLYMGTWGTAIKDNDAFADIYGEFFKLYNKGEHPEDISKKVIAGNWEVLGIEEENHSLWFAIALAQWETKSLDKTILSTVENIIHSGNDLKLWLDLGASEQDIKKRKIALENFLQKIQSEKCKAKPRKRTKLKTPIFLTGDCLVFKLKNVNYAGAIVIATDTNPETAYNLVATTRINQPIKPTIKDFEEAEILVSNYGDLPDHPNVTWYSPGFFYKKYSGIYEVVGRVPVEIEYDIKNYAGKGYLFKPSYTAGWSMNNSVEGQFKSEISKAKSLRKLTVIQLIKKI